MPNSDALNVSRTDSERKPPYPIRCNLRVCSLDPVDAATMASVSHLLRGVCDILEEPLQSIFHIEFRSLTSPGRRQATPTIAISSFSSDTRRVSVTTSSRAGAKSAVMYLIIADTVGQLKISVGGICT